MGEGKGRSGRMGECEWGSEYEQGRQEVGVWRSVGGVSKECEQETVSNMRGGM